MLKRSLVTGLCSVLMLAGGASSAWAAIVADNGFRPNPDGFSFENYGNDSGYENLTSVEMQKLFGRGVCASRASAPTITDPAPTEEAGGKATTGSSQPSSGSGSSSGSSTSGSGSSSASSGPPSFTAASQPSPCNLTPPAQQWMAAQNKGMNGGHCNGLAVLSEQLYKKQFPPFPDGMNTYDYNIQGNKALQHAIAYGFVYQSLDSVVTKRLHADANTILAKLKQALTPSNNETYTLGIYKPNGSDGHAITPYAVEDLGGGMSAIDVYDNNYPGQARQVLVNTTANTWSYNSAPNPQSAPELYGPGAKDPNLEIDPTTPGEGVQPCPFCGDAGAARDAGVRGASGLDTVQLEGNLHYHAHLVISDSSGHQVGVIGGNIVNQFPGAFVQPTLAFSDYNETQEPTYLIPSRNVTITVDGSALRHSDTETLSDVGPGQDLAVQNLRVNAGQKDPVKLTNGLEHMTLTLPRGKSSGSPVIHIGADSSKADVALTLKLIGPKPGSTVHVKLNSARQLITFYTTGNRGTARFTLSAVKETAKDKILEGTDTITLSGQQSVTYSYAK